MIRPCSSRTVWSLSIPLGELDFLGRLAPTFQQAYGFLLSIPLGELDFLGRLDNAAF